MFGDLVTITQAEQLVAQLLQLLLQQIYIAVGVAEVLLDTLDLEELAEQQH